MVSRCMVQACSSVDGRSKVYRELGIFMASEDARLQKVLSFPSITEAFLEVPPQPIYFPTSKCHMDMLPRQEQAKLAACPGSSIVTGSSGKSGKHTVASARAVQGLRWISKSPQLEFTKIQCAATSYNSVRTFGLCRWP
ncbi:hypothetical protein EUGRSUZ_G00004 [Eucalyptus grandis]|uniref:Uncharacterized protein n=2 Tax=Eucalyptus grandis TaxID=71139 RepID=A0ACC3JYU2_EUCGR|nr:hypothetical protein EUGRSUZ_G00004 [Eucalyptus grandis]